MVLRAADVITMARGGWPAFLRQIEAVERVDLWGRGKQQDIEETSDAPGGGVFMPDGRGSTNEYNDLASRAPAPWARLLVDALVQTMFLEGVYVPGSNDPLTGWGSWLRNGMRSRQIGLYRAAVTHGIAYASCLPGRDALTGDAMSVMRPHSARRMAAFYDDPAGDEYPRFAIEAELQQTSDLNKIWFVKVYDEQVTHYLQVRGNGEDRRDWTYISYDTHGLGVTPIVRYSNQIDLDGRTLGEIEPVIPLLRRIDQSSFDRLIVQRFGAWKVRYATGLAKPESVQGQMAQAMRLKVEDLLVNTSTEGKFGVLDATDIAGFISAHDADLRVLSAVTQTPPHHMLGLSSNMQAESLAAVEAGLSRKSFERKTNTGESHGLLFRLDAHVRGDKQGARQYEIQARWRDHEARSLSMAADAAGKLATQVDVPVQMLWEKYLPDWDDTDTQRALKLIEDGAVDRLLEAITRQEQPANDPAAQPPVPGDDDA